MNSLELGWIAGIIDGEGTLSLRKRRYGSHPYPRIQVGSTDEDIIDRLHATGYGNKQGPYDRGGKPMYFWDCGKREEVKNVLLAIYPLLSFRRQTRALEILEQCYEV